MLRLTLIDLGTLGFEGDVGVVPEFADSVVRTESVPGLLAGASSLEVVLLEFWLLVSFDTACWVASWAWAFLVCGVELAESMSDNFWFISEL